MSPTIGFMSEQTVETPPADPDQRRPAAAPAVEKRFRRTTLSTGFSDVPGKTCDICGFEGFRWQTKCPEGHPLT